MEGGTQLLEVPEHSPAQREEHLLADASGQPQERLPGHRLEQGRTEYERHDREQHARVPRLLDRRDPPVDALLDEERDREAGSVLDENDRDEEVDESPVWLDELPEERARPAAQQPGGLVADLVGVLVEGLTSPVELLLVARIPRIGGRGSYRMCSISLTTG